MATSSSSADDQLARRGARASRSLRQTTTARSSSSGSSVSSGSPASSTPSTPAASLSRARDLGVDTCGRIVEFWGFTRTMGRAFGLLYLSPTPLPQSEIQARLDISAGSASMTLAALGRWGVVHRIWVRGERREHYQAETDFWKMISGVLNERERREIAGAIVVVEKAKVGAEAVAAGARGKLKAEAAFVAERLQRLDDICRLGQTMLDMLLGQLRLDVGRFREVLRVPPPDELVASKSPPPRTTRTTRRTNRPTK